MSKEKADKNPSHTKSALERFIACNSGLNSRPKYSDINIRARNEKQREYLRSFKDYKITIGVGPAGCGKTMLPTVRALEDLVDERVRKIVLIRPSVDIEGENEVGALPGDIFGKFGPQLKAITDTLVEYLGTAKLNALMMNETIEIVPVQFVRGRSFKDCWILVDEAQNLSVSAMKAVLTRAGENCKMAIAGDIEQSDRATNDGLADFIRRLKKHGSETINLVQFDKSHIERDPVVAEVLSIYESDVE